MATAKTRRKGEVALLLLFAISAFAALILASAASFQMACSEASVAFDARMQISSEKILLESIVRDTLQDSFGGSGSAGNPTKAAIDAAVNAKLAALNAQNSGVTFALTASPAGYAQPVAFPERLGGNFTAANWDNFASNETPFGTFGGRYMSFCQREWMIAGVNNGTFTFVRTLDGVQDRTYNVQFVVSYAPLTMSKVVAYSLPGTPGALPPASLPPLTGANGSVVALNGMPAGGWYSTGLSSSLPPGDNAVLAHHLFNNQATARLPFVFRDKAAFSWDAWEYVWSQAYRERLLRVPAASSNRFSFGVPTGDLDDTSTRRAFPNEGDAGAFYDHGARTLTMWIRECMPMNTIYDPTGRATISLRQGWQRYPNNWGQFIFIEGTRLPDGTMTTLTIDENFFDRAPIIMVKDCRISFNCTRIRGALWLSPTCVINPAASQVTITGSYAYCAGARPNARITVEGRWDDTVNASTAVVSPLQAVIGTRVTHD